MYGDPVYGGNRDFAGWDSIGWIGDIQPRGYTDEEVSGREKTEIPVAGDLDCDAVIVGSGPGRLDRRRRAHRGGMVGDRAREGPQPPGLARSRRTSRRAICRTTRSSSTAATSSVPIRSSSRARIAVREADGERLFAGEVNNLPSTVGGGGFHADAKLPALSRGGLPSALARGGVDGATVADWPLQYADLEPHYARPSGLIGVAGDADANPFAAWRSGPYPMPPGPDMFGAILTSEAAAEAWAASRTARRPA